MNRFYEKYCVKADGTCLLDKFEIGYYEEGCTPDGYSYPESLYLIPIKQAYSCFEILRDGRAYFKNGDGELEPNEIEAYLMMGIDTDSQAFKNFLDKIQMAEHYNVETVRELLATVPALDIDSQRAKLEKFEQEQC